MMFVREWWSYFVLVSLAGLLEAFVGEAYKRVRDRVDERLPDDLDLGAGQWLEERIEAGNLPIRLLVDPNATDDAIDAYIPNAKTIVLSAQCFDKRDPSYWAVAAHELGHALVHGKAWILSFFFASARVLSRALFQVGISLKLPGEYAHLAAPHGVFEVARAQHGLAGNPSDEHAYAGLQLELVNDPPLETRIAELVLPTLHLLFVAALWTFLLTAR